MSQMSIKEKGGASKCSNMVTFNEGTTFSNKLLHLEAPLFSFILCSSCWILLLIPLWRLPFVDGHVMVTQPITLLLLLYQDIACISSQNVLKNVACLAKRSQTKLLSNQGFTVVVF